jgi:predicted transcriptional regulator
MARHKTPTLTEAELRLMKIVWDHDQATVNDVVAALPAGNTLAYNTILTTMRILEQKGYLRREKVGRSHVYRPLVSRRQARTKAVRHMVSSFFDGSPEQLMLSVLENEQLTPQEITRLKKMIGKGK